MYESAGRDYTRRRVFRLTLPPSDVSSFEKRFFDFMTNKKISINWLIIVKNNCFDTYIRFIEKYSLSVVRHWFEELDGSLDVFSVPTPLPYDSYVSHHPIHTCKIYTRPIYTSKSSFHSVRSRHIYFSTHGYTDDWVTTNVLTPTFTDIIDVCCTRASNDQLSWCIHFKHPKSLKNTYKRLSSKLEPARFTHK